MASMRKFLLAGVIGLGGLTLLAIAAGSLAYLVVARDLPSIEAMRDIRLQVPMRVYSRDGLLISEFGEMRRTPIRYHETPDLMIKAILAAEDDRFFEHPGVDYQGLIRAALNLIRTGEKTQGGSTITMQVARNIFLSSEKTYLRKLSEIFLALKIEHELSKEEILELYLNKIYLGNRAYGVAAAAQTYYGANVDDLTLAQMAMIAGLPKAPSTANPIADPERAVQRRNYVLRRMHDLHFIDDARYNAAIKERDRASLHGLAVGIDADYLGEMVRNAVIARYGEQAAYNSGLKIYTTLDSGLQRAAVTALRKALIEYDQRHGYRGPEKHVEVAQLKDPDGRSGLFETLPVVGGLRPAVVTRVQESSVTAMLADGRAIEIGWDGLSWANPYIDSDRRGGAPRVASDIVRPGDVIRVARDENGWRLSQIPAVEGAMVALSPLDGAILALTGGFDFQRSNFNRATQAQRQPGSSFKPFIYSAALDKGFTPASVINDAPVVFDDPGLDANWRPENYSGDFYGPTRLRVALMNSRNLVSIRVLQSIGVPYAIDYATRFGFNGRTMPRDLSLALGSLNLTPLELATGYAVFANGGYRVTPYFIDRIVDGNDQVIFQAAPEYACPSCENPAAAPAGEPVSAQTPAGPPPQTGANRPQAPQPAKRVISPQNCYLMTSMMRDVITGGTAIRARQLGRGDLAGKTGTTNDLRDAWFAGFNSDLVAVSWVGFDQPASLGSGETGAHAALPMWIDFMREALRGKPEKPLTRPPGLVTVRIDPDTGLLASSNQQNGIFETFPAENVPHESASPRPISGGAGGQPSRGSGSAVEHLF
jgi:penicillin-binding protein 1A